MTPRIRRVPIFVKILIIVFCILFLIGGSFGVLGFYVNDSVRIMPNVFLDGDYSIDLSGLTYEEAIQMLGVLNEEQRARNATVTLQLPLSSELQIIGEDMGLRVNTRDAIEDALAYGRNAGFIGNTLYYIRGFLGATHHVYRTIELDTDYVYHNVSQFAERFNSELAAQSTPSVNDEYIAITLGAGHTSANTDELYRLVLNGLFDSFQSGEPVIIEYMPPEFDEFRLVQVLETLWQQTRVSPVSAVYDRETRTIMPDVPGVTFDFPDAVSLLRATEIGELATIELIDVEAEITKQYMESFLFVDTIGEETTRVGGTDNRVHNIRLAVDAIHGYVLEPGEEFSFNRIVGRRTAAAGFRSAYILSGGQFILGIGGGICQVSSTIFSAIRDTDILVTERRPHGRPVDYLPRGRDATVAWGHIDFRFVNNTERPLRIDVLLDGRTLTAKVEGTLPVSWGTRN